MLHFHQNFNIKFVYLFFQLPLGVKGNIAYNSATGIISTDTRVCNVFYSSCVVLTKLDQFLWRKSVYLLYAKKQEADYNIEIKLAGTYSSSDMVKSTGIIPVAINLVFNPN